MSSKSRGDPNLHPEAFTPTAPCTTTRGRGHSRHTRHSSLSGHCIRPPVTPYVILWRLKFGWESHLIELAESGSEVEFHLIEFTGAEAGRMSHHAEHTGNGGGHSSNCLGLRKVTENGT